jgi:hypothetical protein
MERTPGASAPKHITLLHGIVHENRYCFSFRACGWIVTGELQVWQFRIDVIPAGLRISASAPGGGDPAEWVVPG